MTQLLYLNDTYCFEGPANLIETGTDERGAFVILNQTLFYPQGGGQAADHGTISGEGFLLKVKDVRFVDGIVRHYVDELPQLSNLPISVTMKIDDSRRRMNARLHSAGHLISSVTEECAEGFRAVKGHHFPGEAYVEFMGAAPQDESFLAHVTECLNAVINDGRSVATKDLSPELAAELLPDLPYELPKNKDLRVCEIQGYTPAPCGGTHVRNVSEIAGITLTKMKTKKDRTKISYELV